MYIFSVAETGLMGRGDSLFILLPSLWFWFCFLLLVAGLLFVTYIQLFFSLPSVYSSPSISSLEF